MSFPRYPEYKDSGIEWLGEVPGHWEVGKLRWLASRYAGGTPDKANSSYWTDGSIPWLASGAVNQVLIAEPSAFITEEAFRNSSAKWVPAGALVMALAGQGKTKGMVAQLCIDATCNQSIAAILPSAQLHSRFLFWWLHSNYENIRNLSGGDLRDGLNLELLGEISCPLPPAEEQSSIATFLDRETGKIDALVAEQDKLIALLKEKRQAVISHAVTKGLDPSVPMKDSGIEWLGKVPAHWEIKKLKYIVRISDGIQMGPFGGMLLDLETEDTGFRVYGQQNTICGNFDIGDRWISEKRYRDLERYRLERGDIVLTRKGSLGNARLVSSCTAPGIIDSDTIRLRLNDEMAKPEYISFLFHQSAYIEEQISQMKRGAILSGINSETIANIIIALPPKDEQGSLDMGIFVKTSAVDALITEAQRAIELLKERRSALISAAVTGKIDVRGLVSPREVAV